MHPEREALKAVPFKNADYVTYDLFHYKAFSTLKMDFYNVTKMLNFMQKKIIT